MPSQFSNLLLASLSIESRKSLLTHSTEVALPVKTSLYKANQTPAYAYFLNSGMASVVASTRAGGTVEVGVIGHEGIVGGFHLLGSAALYRPNPSCSLREGA